MIAWQVELDSDDYTEGGPTYIVVTQADCIGLAWDRVKQCVEKKGTNSRTLRPKLQCKSIKRLGLVLP